jgi:hypothetical protein
VLVRTRRGNVDGHRGPIGSGCSRRKLRFRPGLGTPLVAGNVRGRSPRTLFGVGAGRVFASVRARAPSAAAPAQLPRESYAFARSAGTKSLQWGHLKPRWRSVSPAISSALNDFLQ